MVTVVTVPPCVGLIIKDVEDRQSDTKFGCSALRTVLLRRGVNGIMMLISATQLYHSGLEIFRGCFPFEQTLQLCDQGYSAKILDAFESSQRVD